MPEEVSDERSQGADLHLCREPSAREAHDTVTPDRRDDVHLRFDGKSVLEGSWREQNRFWTAVELSAMLTLGGVQYWIDKGGSPNWAPSDWPSRFAADSQILDTNKFVTNYSHHTIAGAGFHVAARSNDLSLLESAAWGLGASLAWEYVVEFRDKADINDIVFTTPAGLAAGEFAHRLGRLLQQRGGSRGWNVARWSLGLPQSLNDALTGAEPGRGPWIEHDFEIGAAVSHGRSREHRLEDPIRDDGVAGSVRFGGTLTAFEEREREPEGWRGFRDSNITSLDAELSLGGGRSNIYVFSDTVLAGWRHFSRENQTGLGHEVHVGTSTAVRYHRERYGSWRDDFGMAHLPGLAVDAVKRGQGWGIKGLLRVHPDYGGVRALGYQDWQDAYPDERGISVVEIENYYHAWGGSARLGAEIEAWRLRAGGSMFLGTYRPHTNLDEFREGRPHHEPDEERGNNTTVQQIDSRFFDYELWLRGSLRGDGFVQARIVSRSRRESFDEFDTRARALQTGIEVGTRF